MATFAGAVALFLTFFFGFRVWKPRLESELTHSGFRKLADQARTGDPALIDELLNYYQHVIGTRKKNNSERVDQLKKAQTAWWFAVGLTLVELLIAILTRLLG